MGVDAEMFVRIKGREKWLPQDEELRTAYELASTIGASQFLITKGGDISWSQHHALEIMKPVKDAADAEDYGLDGSHVGRTVWTQDGDPIIAADDEQFIRIHLWSRYYGESYARGNWPVIRAVAEWLELRFPGSEVWYGGDSSGICAEHLSAARREELNRFFLGSGRKTYMRYDDGPDRVTGHLAPACPACEVRMFNTGGGCGDSSWSCDGCENRAVIASDKKVTFGKGDVFKLADAARSQRLTAKTVIALQRSNT